MSTKQVQVTYQNGSNIVTQIKSIKMNQPLVKSLKQIKPSRYPTKYYMAAIALDYDCTGQLKPLSNPIKIYTGGYVEEVKHRIKCIYIFPGDMGKFLTSPIWNKFISSPMTAEYQERTYKDLINAYLDMKRTGRNLQSDGKLPSTIPF